MKSHTALTVTGEILDRSKQEFSKDKIDWHFDQQPDDVWVRIGGEKGVILVADDTRTGLFGAYCYTKTDIDLNNAVVKNVKNGHSYVAKDTYIEEKRIPIEWTNEIPKGNGKLYSVFYIFRLSEDYTQKEFNWSSPVIVNGNNVYKIEYSNDYNGENTLLSINPYVDSSEEGFDEQRWREDNYRLGNGLWKSDGSIEDPKYMAVSNRYNGVWTDWVITKITKKNDSLFTSFAFTRSQLDLTQSVVKGVKYDEYGQNLFLPKETFIDGKLTDVEWYDSIPSGNLDVYMTKFIFSINKDYRTEDITWETPSKMVDSVNFQVEYSNNIGSFDAAYDKLPNLNNYVNDSPEGIDEEKWRKDVSKMNFGEWSDDVISPSYMATANRKNGSWLDWTVSKIKGESGQDTFTSFSFTRSKYDLTKSIVIGMKYNEEGIQQYIPSTTFIDEKELTDVEWFDSIPDGSLDVYMTKYAFIDGKKYDPLLVVWSTPCKMTDDVNFQVEYSNDIDKFDISKDKLPNLTYYINNSKEGVDEEKWRSDVKAMSYGYWGDNIKEPTYMATANKKNGKWLDWTVSKIKGEDGKGAKILAHEEYYCASSDFDTDPGHYDAYTYQPDSAYWLPFTYASAYWNVDNKYMWNIEETRYENVASTYTKPAVVAVFTSSTFTSNAFVRSDKDISYYKVYGIDEQYLPKYTYDGDELVYCPWEDTVPFGYGTIYSVNTLCMQGQTSEVQEWIGPKNMTDSADFQTEYSLDYNGTSKLPNLNSYFKDNAEGVDEEKWRKGALEAGCGHWADNLSGAYWLATATKSIYNKWGDWKVSYIKGEKGKSLNKIYEYYIIGDNPDVVYNGHLPNRDNNGQYSYGAYCGDGINGWTTYSKLLPTDSKRYLWNSEMLEWNDMGVNSYTWNDPSLITIKYGYPTTCDLSNERSMFIVDNDSYTLLNNKISTNVHSNYGDQFVNINPLNHDTAYGISISGEWFDTSEWERTEVERTENKAVITFSKDGKTITETMTRINTTEMSDITYGKGNITIEIPSGVKMPNDYMEQFTITVMGQTAQSRETNAQKDFTIIPYVSDYQYELAPSASIVTYNAGVYSPDYITCYVSARNSSSIKKCDSTSKEWNKSFYINYSRNDSTLTYYRTEDTYNAAGQKAANIGIDSHRYWLWLYTGNKSDPTKDYRSTYWLLADTETIPTTQLDTKIIYSRTVNLYARTNNTLTENSYPAENQVQYDFNTGKIYDIFKGGVEGKITAKDGTEWFLTVPTGMEKLYMTLNAITGSGKDIFDSAWSFPVPMPEQYFSANIELFTYTDIKDLEGEQVSIPTVYYNFENSTLYKDSSLTEEFTTYTRSMPSGHDDSYIYSTNGTCRNDYDKNYATITDDVWSEWTLRKRPYEKPINGINTANVVLYHKSKDKTNVNFKDSYTKYEFDTAKITTYEDSDFKKIDNKYWVSYKGILSKEDAKDGYAYWVLTDTAHSRDSYDLVTLEHDRAVLSSELNIKTIELFKRTSDTAIKPDFPTYYTFTDDTLTYWKGSTYYPRKRGEDVNGWTFGYLLNGDETGWITTATALADNQSATDLIGKDEWTIPAKYTGETKITYEYDHSLDYLKATFGYLDANNNALMRGFVGVGYTYYKESGEIDQAYISAFLNGSYTLSNSTHGTLLIGAGTNNDLLNPNKKTMYVWVSNSNTYLITLDETPATLGDIAEKCYREVDNAYVNVRSAYYVYDIKPTSQYYSSLDNDWWDFYTSYCSYISQIQSRLTYFTEIADNFGGQVNTSYVYYTGGNNLKTFVNSELESCKKYSINGTEFYISTNNTFNKTIRNSTAGYPNIVPVLPTNYDVNMNCFVLAICNVINRAINKGKLTSQTNTHTFIDIIINALNNKSNFYKYSDGTFYYLKLTDNRLTTIFDYNTVVILLTSFVKNGNNDWPLIYSVSGSTITPIDGGAGGPTSITTYNFDIDNFIRDTANGFIERYNATQCVKSNHSFVIFNPIVYSLGKYLEGYTTDTKYNIDGDRNYYSYVKTYNPGAEKNKYLQEHTIYKYTSPSYCINVKSGAVSGIIEFVKSDHDEYLLYKKNKYYYKSRTVQNYTYLFLSTSIYDDGTLTTSRLYAEDGEFNGNGHFTGSLDTYNNTLTHNTFTDNVIVNSDINNANIYGTNNTLSFSYTQNNYNREYFVVSNTLDIAGSKKYDLTNLPINTEFAEDIKTSVTKQITPTINFSTSSNNKKELKISKFEIDTKFSDPTGFTSTLKLILVNNGIEQTLYEKSSNQSKYSFPGYSAVYSTDSNNSIYLKLVFESIGIRGTQKLTITTDNTKEMVTLSNKESSAIKYPKLQVGSNGTIIESTTGNLTITDDTAKLSYNTNYLQLNSNTKELNTDYGSLTFAQSNNKNILTLNSKNSGSTYINGGNVLISKEGTTNNYYIEFTSNGVIIAKDTSVKIQCYSGGVNIESVSSPINISFANGAVGMKFENDSGQPTAKLKLQGMTNYGTLSCSRSGSPIILTYTS